MSYVHTKEGIPSHMASCMLTWIADHPEFTAREFRKEFYKGRSRSSRDNILSEFTHMGYIERIKKGNYKLRKGVRYL